MFNSKKDILFVILAVFFVTNAIVGELIGGKLIIAICLTPMIYFGHFLVRRYLGREQSDEVVVNVAEEILKKNPQGPSVF